MSWKEPTTEVELREACTMVADSDPVSDLLLRVIPFESNIYAAGQTSLELSSSAG